MSAYDSGASLAKLHYDRGYPYLLHLDKAPYGWTVVVGVGHAMRQLQQRGRPFGGWLENEGEKGDLGGSISSEGN